MTHLRQVNRPGDWGYYLTEEDKIDYSKVIVAGHSHGASTAALIGKVRKVARVVSLSGPYDIQNGVPSQWLVDPGQTSPANYFVLSHAREPQHAGHLLAWSTLGLNTFGSPQIVSDVAKGDFRSHQLIVNDVVSNPHKYTSPANQESYAALNSVWRYLFGL